MILYNLVEQDEIIADLCIFSVFCLLSVIALIIVICQLRSDDKMGPWALKRWCIGLFCTVTVLSLACIVALIIELN